MTSHLRRLHEWVASWDYMAILYSMIASALVLILMKWTRVFSALSRTLQFRRSCSAYRKELLRECQHLIVVGRRTGFSMTATYVPLDLIQSDLMRVQDSPERRTLTPDGSFVLVGGPGAGKSTQAKQMVLSHLSNPHLGQRTLPLFFRLRDYVGFANIDEALAHRLAELGFSQPTPALHRLLQTPITLCVLDGLDEVRPEHRTQVVADINIFYHRYFTQRGRLVVTCRKEAYRDAPLDIPLIMEVCPLTNEQIQLFAVKWPLDYPEGKSSTTFWRDLTSTRQVHELARSPLLLVGGLMQYTESNQGIPDERFQYLQRVARWLIADWSTAQGHPPDPLRPLYDRLLPRLAFEMHKEKVAELPLQRALQLIGGWLPSLGGAERDAQTVADSIRTRTGILVAEDGHKLIFAQFGLQEYFASLELTQQVAPQQLASLQPSSWWRESILLAVAQEREPTPFLEAIFTSDPFLAAAAVAECPTPSASLQERALVACVRGVDRGDESVTGSLVPLLRKLRTDLEARLCSELEKRLRDQKKRARIVGLALATAGTDAATDVLARHPEVWETCLRTAGFLSESFEALLFRWTEHGSDDQSARAAEVLSLRLREGVMERLLALLPRVAPAKAHHLSSLLLRHSWMAFGGAADADLFLPLPFVARCVPFVADPERFLARSAESSLKSLASRGAPSAVLQRLYSDAALAPGPVGTALFLRTRKGARCQTHELLSVMTHALEWCSTRALLWCLIAGSLFVAAAILSGVFRTLLGLSALSVVLMSVSFFDPLLPWYGERLVRRERAPGRSNVLLAAIAALLSAALALGNVALLFVAGTAAVLLGITLSSGERTSAEHYRSAAMKGKHGRSAGGGRSVYGLQGAPFRVSLAAQAGPPHRGIRLLAVAAIASGVGLGWAMGPSSPYRPLAIRLEGALALATSLGSLVWGAQLRRDYGRVVLATAQAGAFLRSTTKRLAPRYTSTLIASRP